MGLLWGHKSCQLKCSSVGIPLFTGPQVLPGACSYTGFPQGHILLRASACSSVRSSTSCRWTSAPPWTAMGCRGTVCLTMVLHYEMQGKVATPASRAPPPPPSSLTLVSAELFLSHHLTPLSQLLSIAGFFPFLNMLSLRCYHHH